MKYLISIMLLLLLIIGSLNLYFLLSERKKAAEIEGLFDGLSIENHSKECIYIGQEDVTPQTGFILQPREGITFDTKKITIIKE